MRSRARVALAAVLLAFAADRLAAVLGGGPDLWRVDGAREVAASRAAYALLAGEAPASWLRAPPGAVLLLAAGAAVFGSGQGAFAAARVSTLAAVLAALLVFLRAGEGEVWRHRLWITAAVAAGLAWGLRDVALNVSGQGATAALVLLGAALGMGIAAPATRVRALLLGLLAAIFSSAGGAVVAAPLLGGLCVGRGPSSARVASWAGLGWLAAALAAGLAPAALVAGWTQATLVAVAAIAGAGLVARAASALAADEPASPAWIAGLGALVLVPLTLALAADPLARLRRAWLLALCLAGLAMVALLSSRLPVVTRAGERRRNVVLGAACASAALAVLEMIAAHVPRSHGVGYALSARLWARNLLPVNAAGFRDGEYTPERASRPRKIVVVGDSFAQGAGVADVRERFAGVLAAGLPQGHEVFVLAEGGIDTAREYELLRRFPWRPAAVVLSYHPNDIEDRAAERGPTPPFTPYLDLPGAAQWPVRRSYLLNLVYWLFPHGDTDAYRRFLQAAHADPGVRAAHLADVDGIADLARDQGAPLIVVLFPFLDDVRGSAPLLAPVRAHLSERGVRIVEVADLVGAMPVRDLVVHAQDAHPSAAVHRRVGEALAELLSEPVVR